MKWTNRTTGLTCLAAAFFLATGCSTTEHTYAGHTSSGDKAFVRQASADGLKEVEMARLGVERAQSPEVQQLARTLLDDHTQSNTELMSIAQRNDISTPTHLPEPASVAHLQNASGPEFDRIFINHMLRDHQKDIDMFQAAANKATNPEVRDFAARNLPILQEHLRTTESIASSRRYGTTHVYEPAGVEVPAGSSVTKYRVYPGEWMTPPTTNPHLGGERQRRHNDTTENVNPYR